MRRIVFRQHLPTPTRYPTKSGGYGYFYASIHPVENGTGSTCYLPTQGIFGRVHNPGRVPELNTQ
eukprot:scaffold12521_cov125-Skeletonema_dohrnii-CCMP3373.AAC.6